MFAQRREEAAQFDSAAANVVEEDHFKRRQIKLMNKARALEADSRNLMLFAQRDVLSKAEVNYSVLCETWPTLLAPIEAVVSE